jgi:hypothetical protein
MLSLLPPVLQIPDPDKKVIFKTCTSDPTSI